jgi:hypothetical protein
MLTLCSCAHSYRQICPPELEQNIMEQMNNLYDPITEKSFCLSSKGIHNVIEGNFISVPLPLCNKTDMVVHTHGYLSENNPTNVDERTWNKYKEMYGNWVFGIMLGPNKLKVYIIE